MVRTRCATASSLGANGPGLKCGLASPRCTDSHAAQSCLLVMSQKSTAPRASGWSSLSRPPGVDVPGALDPGAARRERHHPVCHHVVGVGGDEKVGQQVEVLHPHRVDARQWRRGELARQRHRGHPVTQVHRPADPRAGQVVVVAGVRGRHRAQLRVDERAVVALVVVLRDHLPVRGDLVGVTVGERQRPAVVRRQDALQLAEVLVERRHPLVTHRVERVPEHPTRPEPHRQLHQAVLLGAEAGLVAEARCPDQLTVGAVGPGVVGALDALPLRRAAFGDQLVPAVTAGVREHAHAFAPRAPPARTRRRRRPPAA